MTTTLPRTAIVLGAGCSRNLGVPLLAGFMDRVFDKLDPDDCRIITDFLEHIRKSAAYARTDLLNIEEIYGLADMALSLESLGRAGAKVRRTVATLNKAIYEVAQPAGAEFIMDLRLQQAATSAPIIMRESAAESDQFENLGNRHTNLLAYLCLAAHRDRGEKGGDIFPLFIQFNWDVALERALACGKNGDLFSWYGSQEPHDYTKCPRVTRPHGGIHWRYGRKRRARRRGFNAAPNEDLKAAFCAKKLPFRDKDGIFLWAEGRLFFSANGTRSPDLLPYMAIVPPTWKKFLDDSPLAYQWAVIKHDLQEIRRLVFIGYSLPRTDVYFRHFIALALAEAKYIPKVYVWNPAASRRGPVRESYLDLFEPLSREGRLFYLDAYFGNPALYDLDRALERAKPLRRESWG
ncbi:MAG: hypothetical protein AB1634_05235 [Thermodesulfobacteriota bacterium]